MEVIVVIEENHGEILSAVDFENTIRGLNTCQWLDEYTEIYDFEEHKNKTVGEIYGENWKEVILSRGMEQFNEDFEGIFYLDWREVWGI